MLTITDFATDEQIEKASRLGISESTFLFSFIPNKNLLDDMLNCYKVSKSDIIRIDFDCQSLSKKYPDILFEDGDISWFFNAFVNGEIIQSFYPSDWKDKRDTKEYDDAVEKYNKLKEDFTKRIKINR